MSASQPHPSFHSLQGTVTLERTPLLGLILPARRVTRTLLGAGAMAVQPLAWLASFSDLPTTSLLLSSAEKRLLLTRLALAMPSGEEAWAWTTVQCL